MCGSIPGLWPQLPLPVYRIHYNWLYVYRHVLLFNGTNIMVQTFSKVHCIILCHSVILSTEFKNAHVMCQSAIKTH